uniref:Uncharacterized protein n=1 Tax=Desertifilum tharense IPPAS B-1220 TaxID=1781255 RepID=A0ACD5H0W6_9CYAN
MGVGEEGSWELGVGEEEGGGMGRWGDGGKKGVGSWELGVRGWGRRMGRRRELGVGEEGWGKQGNGELGKKDGENKGKLAIVPDTYLEHRYLVCKLQHFRLSTLLRTKPS